MIADGPVLVTVVPARTAKVPAVSRPSPVPLSSAGQERLDLVGVEVGAGLGEERSGARDDRSGHRRAADMQELRSPDARRAERLEGAAGGQRGDDVRAGGDHVGLGEAVLGDAAAREARERVVAGVEVPGSSVAPTEITYGSLPGAYWTASSAAPRLPAAATTTMPACQANSTAASSGSSR